MPVHDCTENGKPGYRWGEAGKCYTYTAGNESSRKNAKRKAILQGVAVEGGSVEGMIDKMAKDEENSIDVEFMAKSFNDDQNMIFGWAYVAQDEQGNQMVDHSEEVVLKEDFYDLENAVYAFNLAFRKVDLCMLGSQKATVESMVFSKEKNGCLKYSERYMPQGHGRILFPDDADYKFIKSMKILCSLYKAVL